MQILQVCGFPNSGGVRSSLVVREVSLEGSKMALKKSSEFF